MSLETSFQNLFVFSKPTHLKLLNKCFILSLTQQDGMYYDVELSRMERLCDTVVVNVLSPLQRLI